MRTSLILTAAAATFALTMGCETPEADDSKADAYADHLPDDRLLVGIPAGGNRAVGELADTYATTVQVSGDINALIGNVLDTIDHITDFEPTYSSDDDEYLWGPWDDGGLDPNHTALYVRYDATADAYGWAIIQRDKQSTSDDDWVPIIAGEANEGETEDLGDGHFIIDFDAMTMMNPGEEVKGGLFVSTYDLTDEGVVAEAAFHNFTEDGSDPVTVGYRYTQDTSGAGRMDLAYEADVQEDGSDLETVVLRTRWMADGAGRGDMVIFGGDLGVLAYQGSECWDTGFSVTYEENNADLTMDGDESTCAFSEPDWNEDAPADES